ncbi:MAG: hypothetical protein LQ352_005392 [Teloschistes flavicans]|nr:MAG: hypothetical protein LQ352_005392 [Teloschistes flavicans]
MALLVITVKLYHPFDSIDRHPRSLTEPGTLGIDWDRWCEIQENYDARDTAGDKLGRGNEIKVAEADVFKLSGDQIDEYLDWFEKTWVDEERARKQPRGYPDQLLDMFPTGKPDGSTRQTMNVEQERRNDEEALEAKLQAVQGTLKPRQIISDKDAKSHEEPVARIGSFYKRYRKAEDLPATAKMFHETAASLIAVKVKSSGDLLDGRRSKKMKAQIRRARMKISSTRARKKVSLTRYPMIKKSLYGSMKSWKRSRDYITGELGALGWGKQTAT